MPRSNSNQVQLKEYEVAKKQALNKSTRQRFCLWMNVYTYYFFFGVINFNLLLISFLFTGLEAWKEEEYCNVQSGPALVYKKNGLHDLLL